MIGLRLAAEHPKRFSRLVVANTGLPAGDFVMPETWWQFRTTIENQPTIPVSSFLQFGSATQLSDAVCAAYDAPFPDDSYCAGPRAIPGLVPTSPDDPAAAANRAAWQAPCESTTPMLVAFSDSDPITGPMAALFRTQMRGAQGVEHPVIHGAGHSCRKTPATNSPNTSSTSLLLEGLDADHDAPEQSFCGVGSPSRLGLLSLLIKPTTGQPCRWEH